MPCLMEGLAEKSIGCSRSLMSSLCLVSISFPLHLIQLLFRFSVLYISLRCSFLLLRCMCVDFTIPTTAHGGYFLVSFLLLAVLSFLFSWLRTVRQVITYTEQIQKGYQSHRFRPLCNSVCFVV